MVVLIGTPEPSLHAAARAAFRQLGDSAIAFFRFSLNNLFAHRVLTQIWKRTLVIAGEAALASQGSPVHRYGTW